MDGRRIKKPRRDIRATRLELRLTPEELTLISRAAKAEALPLSVFVRWKLLKGLQE